MTKEEKRRQMIKVAKYYYNEHLTQEEIAERLQLSRQKVGRMVQKLIPEGIVKIVIDDSMDDYIDLEQRMEKKFGLKEVLIVECMDSPHQTMDSLGKAAAAYLDRALKPDMIFGVAWGRTLAYVSRHISKEKLNLNLSVVQLAGGVFSADQFIEGQLQNQLSRQSGEITKDIAIRLGAKPYLMHNPLFVDNRETKQVLMQESSIANVFQMAAKCHMAMVSIASLGKSVSPFREGMLGEKELQCLHEKKAVGNFLFHYFDMEGNMIETNFYDRLMCPEIEDLRQIPIKICVAGTREKINAIYGGIRAGLVDVLITDSETAKALLKK
ncbi:sugar-binding transcriptional regulator [Alkalibacter rhizosphaerae]|uniref:Sugar-binding transcriptional regulator n=1 Tax=Alkalibacter rhizosphaerae TaxID=2815577 RepID=A0A974XE04_9FIRM|nr:sugar-binding transcriptional regulator [Alkalibacter rhizosphaerae]QSX08114.1 sugar-binding transcriptional regulator [Alkalibacter rhizosphaerae]